MNTIKFYINGVPEVGHIVLDEMVIPNINDIITISRSSGYGTTIHLYGIVNKILYDYAFKLIRIFTTEVEGKTYFPELFKKD